MFGIDPMVALGSGIRGYCGKPSTPFMQIGDTATIDMQDANGHSIFGQIKQKVTKTG